MMFIRNLVKLCSWLVFHLKLINCLDIVYALEWFNLQDSCMEEHIGQNYANQISNIPNPI